jgi:hypothetical protein
VEGSIEFTSNRILVAPDRTVRTPLDAETVDVGATVEDARAPQPSRLDGLELPSARIWFMRWCETPRIAAAPASVIRSSDTGGN